MEDAIWVKVALPLPQANIFVMSRNTAWKVKIGGKTTYIPIQPKALKELQVSFKRYGKLLILIKLKAQNVK